MNAPQIAANQTSDNNDLTLLLIEEFLVERRVLRLHSRHSLRKCNVEIKNKNLGVAGGGEEFAFLDLLHGEKFLVFAD